MTPAETALWDAIRGSQIDGLQFRKQHAFARYILDFCCLRHKLVVELDGAVHNTSDAIEHDQLRDDFLASCGYRTLRFRNDEVFANIADVIGRIRAAAAETSGDL